jgi:hypothetical protein
MQTAKSAMSRRTAGESFPGHLLFRGRVFIDITFLIAVNIEFHDGRYIMAFIWLLKSRKAVHLVEPRKSRFASTEKY